jgi:signal transduction histidine kinase
MQFTQIHFVLAAGFLLYGLAFFSMGLVTYLESRRSSGLAEARILIPLSVFGFLHAFHEWLVFLEVHMMLAGRIESHTLSIIRLTLLAIANASLIAFAVQMLMLFSRWKIKDYLFSGGMVLIWAMVLFFTEQTPFSDTNNWQHGMEITTRLLLGVPGALLAAFALWQQSLHVELENRIKLSVCLRRSSILFVLYCIGQLLVFPYDDFSSALSVRTLIMEVPYLQVEGVRAFLALSITFSLIRAVKIVDQERKNHLQAIQDDRLMALEQLQNEFIRRDEQRREMLRYNVITQERERSRIARSLHNEIAQQLTAANINLAALRNQIGEDEKTAEMVERLDDLFIRMSKDLKLLVLDLRPAMLDDLGLVQALRFLTDEGMPDYSMDAVLEVIGTPRRLDNLAETVLFRVAQKSIHNAVCYAGVEQIFLSLEFDKEFVELKIVDHGVGFDFDEIEVSQNEWGLLGMKERVEAIGGEFKLTTAPGKGTVVSVKLNIVS